MDEMKTLEEMIKKIMEQRTLSLSDSNSKPCLKYDCELCHDNGYIVSKDEEGRLMAKECTCMPVKRAKELISRSGLADFIEKQRFDNFYVKTPTQETIKMAAENYANRMIELKGNRNEQKPWLYIGGNPGAGKTHICTAVCAKLMNEGIPVRYMQWLTDARMLKVYVNSEDFDSKVSQYIDADVLYIDDLFKQKYAQNPTFTEADIKIAFTILNNRYFMNKPTIISSEWDLIDQLLPVDEGLFSRVYERCRGYLVMIDRRRENDYRLGGI